jgi:formate/nitrite transporter FocA (FNT family)
MLMHWLLCFFGNMAGALFVMAVIIGCRFNLLLKSVSIAVSIDTQSHTDGGVFDKSPYREHAIDNAKQKQVDLQFHQIFIRGIGCNWLVCLSIYLGLQAKDVTSKAVGMWWPIFAFVTLGLEHVVANMFFIPIGLFLGTPGLTVGLYIWKGKCGSFARVPP